MNISIVSYPPKNSLMHYFIPKMYLSVNRQMRTKQFVRVLECIICSFTKYIEYFLKHLSDKQPLYMYVEISQISWNGYNPTDSLLITSDAMLNLYSPILATNGLNYNKGAFHNSSSPVCPDNELNELIEICLTKMTLNWLSKNSGIGQNTSCESEL